MQFQRGNIGLFFKGDPTLKLWMPFDENGGTVTRDLSGNGNHGTLTNGALFNPGKFGSGIYFDGVDDYIRVPENDSLDPSSITIMSWVKMSQSFTITGDIVEKGENKGYRFRINDNRTVSWFDRGAVNYLNTTETIPPNTWTNIIVTGGTGGLKIYINGRQSASNSTAYGGPNTSDVLTIGTCTEFSEYFNGLIDEVAIFSRALSSQEISEYYKWATGTPKRLFVIPKIPAPNFFPFFK